MSTARIQGELQRAGFAIGPVPRRGSWTPGEPTAAGEPPGSGKAPSVRLAADEERGGSDVTGRAERPKPSPLDRLLLTFAVVFATLTLLMTFSLHSGAWGNGVIMAFLIPGLAMGALVALVGVVVVPVKHLYRWGRWRRAFAEQAR